MPLTIHLDIVSAEGSIFSGLAEMVVLPAEMGEIGVFARHAPLLTRLKPGLARVRIKPDHEETFFISGGIVEIQPHLISVLADTVVRTEEMDEASALEAKKRVEEAIEKPVSEDEYKQLSTELHVVMSYLRIFDEIRKQKKP